MLALAVVARIAPVVGERAARHALDGHGEEHGRDIAGAAGGPLCGGRLRNLGLGGRDRCCGLRRVWQEQQRADPQAEHERQRDRYPKSHGAQPHGWNTTGVPPLTISDSRAASQFVSRTQPWLSVRPIFCGSGVPWMP